MLLWVVLFDFERHNINYLLIKIHLIVCLGFNLFKTSNLLFLYHTPVQNCARMGKVFFEKKKG
jgi:hypothetical protein